MADVAVPNLGSGIDEFLTRLRAQRTARADVDHLFGGGGSDSGSADTGVVKVTQVASSTQKWAIVKYVIIGVMIVAGLGVILYFVFNTGPGKDLKEQVKNNLPLGDRKKPKPEQSSGHRVAAQRSAPSNTGPPRGSPVPPPPPIRSSIVAPYNQPPVQGPQQVNYAQQGPMRLEPHGPTLPSQHQPSQNQPIPQQPQGQAPPRPQPTNQPQPAPAPAPQPQPQVLKLVPRQADAAPPPKPKPNIGNVGGLPGPL